MNPSNGRPLRHLTRYTASPPSLRPSLTPSVRLCLCLCLSACLCYSITACTFSSSFFRSSRCRHTLRKSPVRSDVPLSVCPSIRLYFLPSTFPQRFRPSIPSSRLSLIHPSTHPFVAFLPSVRPFNSYSPSFRPSTSHPSILLHFLPCQSVSLSVPPVLSIPPFLHLTLSIRQSLLFPKSIRTFPASFPPSVPFPCPSSPSPSSNVRPPVRLSRRRNAITKPKR